MRITIKGFVLRGLIAGAAGGLATALFIRFVTETQINWAINIEEAAGLGLPAEEAAEFSRATQHWGGMLAAIIFGAFLGIVLGVVTALLHDKVKGKDEFGRVAKIAAAAFVATSLLPGLKYPANPPTVGDPDTISERTAAYVGLVLVCVGIVIAARWIWLRLTDRGFTGGARFLLGAGAAAFMVTIAFVVFPPNPDRIEPPNNEAAPALVVADTAPPEVLDAMLENAKTVGDESYRDPDNPEEALDLDAVSSGSALVGTPVAISATKITPHVYTSLIWKFRMWSWAGIALLWVVMAGVLGLLLDHAAGDSTDAST